MIPDCLYVGLGGNMAGTKAALIQAVDRLSKIFKFRAISSLYLTEAQDYFNQAPFLNLVGAWEYPFEMDAVLCLKSILDIESELGRNRIGAIPKGPRLIDLDLLLARNVAVVSSFLTIPHPRMHLRRFVLEPLLEIAPDLISPDTGRSYQSMLSDCTAQGIYSKTPLKYTDSSI